MSEATPLYQQCASWFYNQSTMTPKRLMYFMYLLNAWSKAIYPELDLDLEFYTISNDISEKTLKHDYLAVYGNNPIPSDSLFTDVNQELWLLKSVYTTYYQLSDSELHDLIINDDAYQKAKIDKKYHHVILDTNLENYYKFLYNKDK